MIEAKKKLIFEDCRKSCTDSKALSGLKDQTILVTGGTGFVGKWIAEMVRYLNEVENLNIHLYLLSRNSKRFAEEVPHLSDLPFVTLIGQDVRNLHNFPEATNYIIHAAGSPDNRDHVSQPLRTLEAFFKGTNAALDAASRLPSLKKFVHLSSHQAYGNNVTENSIKETFLGTLEPNHVNHVYSEAKRASETLCSIFRSQFRMPVVTLRPFAFIGPYQNLDKPWAINNFIRDGLLGGPIRILGNGLTVRSYLYASDMAYWIVKSLIYGIPGEIYNLGSRGAISLNDLAERVQRSIDPRIEILSKSSKESYTTVSKLVPDISKTASALNVWETYTIEEAIHRTIIWNQLNKQ